MNEPPAKPNVGKSIWAKIMKMINVHLFILNPFLHEKSPLAYFCKGLNVVYENRLNVVYGSQTTILISEVQVHGFAPRLSARDPLRDVLPFRVVCLCELSL